MVGWEDLGISQSSCLYLSVLIAIDWIVPEFSCYQHALACSEIAREIKKELTWKHADNGHIQQ